VKLACGSTKTNGPSPTPDFGSSAFAERPVIPA
jgi:hypothetical protein